MDKKLGVYICSGCGIGDVLDIEALTKLGKGELKAPICKTHPYLCGPEGAELIRNDIANEGVNTIIVAACSPRANYDVFDFPGCIVDRANLREQVVWSQKPNEELDDPNEDIQMMAEDYMRMSGAKAAKMQLPEPFRPEQEMSKDILVVGGGISGLTAANEVAKAGYNAVLVEKEKELGGFQKGVARRVSFPYKEAQDNPLPKLIEAVTANDRIKVYTGAKVEKTVGGPCVFQVTIKQGEEVFEHNIGAVVMAAGWKPYDPKKLDPKLGFGQSPNVITNTKFEELNKAGKLARPSDGKALKNVAFLQCAGSRDKKHLPYCSTICCLASLKQAVQIKEKDPDANVFVVYKELRTPGQAEDYYRKAQEAGVLFIRCQDPQVLAQSGTLAVEALDELLGDTVVLDNLDMVVLATGMVPATAFGQDYKEWLKHQAAGDEGEDAPKKEEESEVPLDPIRVSDIINLQYRQGPELPELRNGFPDSHFICFPYESRRTGIYAAGCVRRPMGSAATMEDAAGAAMKAVQCVELTSLGKAVHPRAGDMTYPEFFMQRCTQCKRCTEECPFGAINEDEKGNPLPQPTRCRRCGVCMGACPERIISFKNYSVDIIGSAIKSLDVPEEDEEKPRILVLACENDAYPALDMAGLNRITYSPWIRILPLRCLGSLNLIWIADALSKGIDGILLLGCKSGDDYQCHFIKGSELADIRLSKIKETLDRLVLESERVRYEQVSIMDYHSLPALLNEFAESIEALDPNPYKGF